MSTPNRSRLETTVSIVLVVCAVLITVNALRSRDGNDYERGIWEVSADDREAALERGYELGGEGAELRIVEFADVECPFCGRYVATLDSLVERYDGRVSVLYRHFPLETVHEHAFTGAIALECSGAQGKFESFYRNVFANQSQIGSLSWAEFADQAAVPDTVVFKTCMEGRDAQVAVESDIRVARRIGVSATPFVVIGGKGLVGARPLDELVRHVDEHLGIDGR